MVSSVLLHFGGMLAVCSAVAWHVCVCSFHHCSWAWGQIPVQRYVASAHAQAMCRRALLAWRGVLVAYFFSWFLSLPLLSWSRVSSPPWFFFLCFGGLFIIITFTGLLVPVWRVRKRGLGAGGLVAGLRVGMPVGVLPPWDVIAVASPLAHEQSTSSCLSSGVKLDPLHHRRFAGRLGRGKKGSTRGTTLGRGKSWSAFPFSGIPSRSEGEVLGGVYMRKLAPARVSCRDDFFISYHVYVMAGSFHISLFDGTLHVVKIHVWFKIANITHAIPFQSTGRPISDRNVRSFRVYMLP